MLASLVIETGQQHRTSLKEKRFYRCEAFEPRSLRDQELTG
jgi:hypothetical protein